MNPYLNEDVMWQRLKDIQREAENRRLYGPRNLPTLGVAVRLVGRGVRWLAEVRVRRAPEPRPVEIADGDCDGASDAA